MDKVRAPQWLKAGQGPPNSTSEAGQLAQRGQALIASCALGECSRGGDLMHQVALIFGAQASFAILGFFGDGLIQAILFGHDTRNVLNFS